MQTISLEAEIRETLSNGKLNLMRREGWIPAILYSNQDPKITNEKTGNTLLKIHEKSFLKAIGNHQKSNAIVELKWNMGTEQAIIKEIQRDILTHKLLHIDFKRISMTEKLEVMVPIHIVGESPGVKLSGGILEHITREVRILSLPKDIPSEMIVDVSQLEIGQGLLVKNIKEVPGIKILSDPNLLVVNVVAPTILEETAAATAEVPTAPEVIAKGKKPLEGEEGSATATPPAAKGTTPAPKTK